MLQVFNQASWNQNISGKSDYEVTMKNIKSIDWADIAKTLGVETNNDER